MAERLCRSRSEGRGAVTTNGMLIFLMAFLFLFLGYLGVPVAFALIAGVLVVTAFTPVGLPSMMAQLFNGIDVEALLAVPFFLLVGELMTNANVTARMITLSQALIGHLRGGLAQVVTLFSMFFAGVSGSSAADVAVLSRSIGPDMKREGYDTGFTAALIASASTMANLIPPSIMAVVYGATGNVSIGGLFLGGVVPGLLVGIGLMIYSHFFGPIGIMRPRAPLREVTAAMKGAAVPTVIPVIIMGGILSGLFTPTEAGVVAVAYILVVAIPLINRGYLRQLPHDMAMTGLLYSIPLITIAAASAFGWMLAYLRGPAVVSGWIASAAGNDPMMIMLLLVALFIIVGDFIDAIPAIIIFMPIISELTRNADVNPVHMGVVIIVTLAFGLITPPYGICLLMASKFIGVRFGRAMIASFPIYVVFLATILFCIYFPDVVLWLPKHFLPESVGCFKNPSGVGYICP
jgi:tripartite ATP-independent transporter DctM subunit